MTWINKPRSRSRQPTSGPDQPHQAPAPSPTPALPPAIQRMLEELPPKATWRPDEFMAYFSIGETLYKELVADGRLVVVQFTPRVRLIQRSAICDYIRQYVTPV